MHIAAHNDDNYNNHYNTKNNWTEQSWLGFNFFDKLASSFFVVVYTSLNSTLKQMLP